MSGVINVFIKDNYTAVTSCCYVMLQRVSSKKWSEMTRSLTQTYLCGKAVCPSIGMGIVRSLRSTTPIPVLLMDSGSAECSLVPKWFSILVPKKPK